MVCFICQFPTYPLAIVSLKLKKTTCLTMCVCGVFVEFSRWPSCDRHASPLQYSQITSSPQKTKDSFLQLLIFYSSLSFSLLLPQNSFLRTPGGSIFSFNCFVWSLLHSVWCRSKTPYPLLSLLPTWITP